MTVMKNALLPAALAAALLAAPAAHAENWFYYPVPGGAMGYDLDSRSADVKTGNAVGDTVVYYFVPRAMGAEAYSFMIRRIEFECRGERYKTLGSAYFDGEGQSLGQADADDWTKVQPATPPAIFKRIICNNDKPPTAKAAGDRDKLVSALKGLPITSEKPVLRPTR